MLRGALVGAWLVAATPALADTALYDRLWPEAPVGGRLTLSQEIADAFTELGHSVNLHLGALSDGRVGMTFDGRRRKAHVRFGATTQERYLVFAFAGDVHFTQGVARVQARLSVGVAGHVLDLELPDFEMAPAEYRGDRGVEIRLPLFKREF